MSAEDNQVSRPLNDAMRSASTRSRRYRTQDLMAWVFNILLIIFAISTIFPLIWVGYSSLKTSAEFAQNVFTLPKRITLDAYYRIMESGLVYTAFANSLVIAVTATVLIVLLSFVIGYVLARYKFPGRDFVHLFFVLGLLLPIPALLVPVFLQYRWLGMLDHRFTLILPYVAFGLSLAVFLMESYIRKIPVELDEAARIDGASMFVVMFMIIFPVCRPIVSTVALLSFLHTWNEFPFAMTLVRSQEYMMIPIWLRTFSGQYTVDYPGMMAGMVVASLPVVIVYLIFNRKIVEGFAAGAVK